MLAASCLAGAAVPAIAIQVWHLGHRRAGPEQQQLPLHVLQFHDVCSWGCLEVGAAHGHLRRLDVRLRDRQRPGHPGHVLQRREICHWSDVRLVDDCRRRDHLIRPQPVQGLPVAGVQRHHLGEVPEDFVVRGYCGDLGGLRRSFPRPGRRPARLLWRADELRAGLGALLHAGDRHRLLVPTLLHPGSRTASHQGDRLCAHAGSLAPGTYLVHGHSAWPC
mmetsp:Transcript_42271/g.106513  ORF Transcript_42271/g.106513 Transcript_42271/m.106513 type:complete len:220 (+) Transcript_42271:2440-3099(+)